jgi:hypothetical protein
LLVNVVTTADADGADDDAGGALAGGDDGVAPLWSDGLRK